MRYSTTATPDYFDPSQLPIILEQAVQPLILLSLLSERAMTILHLLHECRNRSNKKLRIQKSIKSLSELQAYGLIQGYAPDAPATTVIYITPAGQAELETLMGIYRDCLSGIDCCISNTRYVPATPLQKGNLPPSQFRLLFGHQDAVFALILLIIHQRTPLSHREAKYLCKDNGWTVIPGKEYIYRTFMGEGLLQITGKSEDNRPAYSTTAKGEQRMKELLLAYEETTKSILAVLQRKVE